MRRLTPTLAELLQGRLLGEVDEKYGVLYGLAAVDGTRRCHGSVGNIKIARGRTPVGAFSRAPKSRVLASARAGGFLDTAWRR